MTLYFILAALTIYASWIDLKNMPERRGNEKNPVLRYAWKSRAKVKAVLTGTAVVLCYWLPSPNRELTLVFLCAFYCIGALTGIALRKRKK